MTFPAGKFLVPAGTIPPPAGKSVSLGRILTRAGKKMVVPASGLPLPGGQERQKMHLRDMVG